MEEDRSLPTSSCCRRRLFPRRLKSEILGRNRSPKLEAHVLYFFFSFRPFRLHFQFSRLCVFGGFFSWCLPYRLLGNWDWFGPSEAVYWGRGRVDERIGGPILTLGGGGVGRPMYTSCCQGGSSVFLLLSIRYFLLPLRFFFMFRSCLLRAFSWRPVLSLFCLLPFFLEGLTVHQSRWMGHGHRLTTFLKSSDATSSQTGVFLLAVLSSFRMGHHSFSLHLLSLSFFFIFFSSTSPHRL